MRLAGTGPWSSITAQAVFCCRYSRYTANGAFRQLHHPRPPAGLSAIHSPITRRMASNESNVDASPAIGSPSSPPMAGQVIRCDDKEYKTVKEGLAYILTPHSTSIPSAEQKKKSRGAVDGGEHANQSVFYNPIQQFNRDLTTLAIRAYGEHAVAVKQMKHARAAKRREKVSSKKGKKRVREASEEEDAENRAQKKPDKGNGQENGDAAPPLAEPEQKESAGNVPAGPQEWNPQFTILDALSASGLRALRYAKEVPCTTRVIANDLSPAAIESIKLNVRHNGLQDIVRPNIGDACQFMYSNSGVPKPNQEILKFDVVDLDPYGTAAPFLDATVQCLQDGAMICVTCTDAGVFASAGYPEKTFSLYGGTPLKTAPSHEGGLRLILNAVAASAAKYGLAIEPLLSLSIDFYARVFVRVHRSPVQVKYNASKTMLVYNCDHGCGAWRTQPLAQAQLRQGKNSTTYHNHILSRAPTTSRNCEHCGFTMHLAGPMWAGPLHNPHFIQRILDLLPGADKETYPTIPRIEGMLITALEEDLELGGESGEHAPEPDTAPTSEPAPPPPPEPETAKSGPPSLLIPRVDPAKTEPHPFFLIPSVLSKVLHTETMSEDQFRGALRHLGYRSSRSHAKPNSIRTDAPWDVIWEIMREWVKQKTPEKLDSQKADTAGAGVMRRRRASMVAHSASQNDGAGAGFAALKMDLLTAVESGRDLTELTTRVEAALYRSNARRPEPAGEPQGASRSGHASPEQNGAFEAKIDRAEDPSTLNIVFDAALGRRAMAAQQKKRLTRYQINPRANWGPQTRAR